MTLLAKVNAHHLRLDSEYKRMQTHWQAHPLYKFRHKKVLFIGTGALLVWLSRYPAVRRVYFLSNLVT